MRNGFRWLFDKVCQFDYFHLVDSAFFPEETAESNYQYLNFVTNGTLLLLSIAKIIEIIRKFMDYHKI